MKRSRGRTSKPISLVLIDDNRLLREGLAGLIRKQPDFKVLAASADVEEALRKVREAKPRVVLHAPGSRRLYPRSKMSETSFSLKGMPAQVGGAAVT